MKIKARYRYIECNKNYLPEYMIVYILSFSANHAIIVEPSGKIDYVPIDKLEILDKEYLPNELQK